MSEYGFQAVNNLNSITISSAYKVMVFSERGTVLITSAYTDRGGTGSANFLRPIATQEPPQLFVKVKSASHPSLGLYATLLGSPGNWTGFTLNSAASGGGDLQNFVIEYVSCKFTDKVQDSGYGMNIWDENGNPVFSSQDKVVRYNKFATVWTPFVDSSSYSVYVPNVTIAVDEFICVSAMDRGVIWFTDAAQFAAFNIWAGWAPSLTLYAQKTTALGFWYWQGTNNTQFTVPVCTFPVGRYDN